MYQATSADNPILFTDVGLRVLSGASWRLLPYGEIAASPIPAKRPPPHVLNVVTQRGDEVLLAVRADERTSDAFEIARFLDRVRADSAGATRVTWLWTHPSVKAIAGDATDPVPVVLSAAREMVYGAIERGWPGPPFDPRALARLRGIELVATSDIQDARLLARTGGLEIQYNPNRPLGRIRYSIAHELAHSLFPDAAAAARNRDKRDADDWQLELLCNLAAAEILMPTGSLTSALANTKPGVETLLMLQEKFVVSLEAVAIRLVRAMGGRVAAFTAARVQQGAEPRYSLEYVVSSPAWRIPRLRGSPVPKGSVVEQVAAVGFTNATLAPEHWHDDLPPLHVEVVGVAPYPGSVHPRVVGIFFPSGDSSQHLEIPRYVRGSALEPVGPGQKILVHIVSDAAISWGGRSFAAQVRRRWPGVPEDFRRWVKVGEGGPRLGQVHVSKAADDMWVVSVVAMHGYGRLKRPGIRYDALDTGLEKVAELALKMEAGVHMPRIGTGNARGNWDVIVGLIQENLLARGVPVTVYDFPQVDLTRARPLSSAESG